MAKNDKKVRVSFDQNTECENKHKGKESIYKRLQRHWERGIELLGRNHCIGLLVLLLLLCVFFISFLEKTYSSCEDFVAKTFVDNLFSHFEQNIISDSIIYLIFLCLVINCILAKPKRHSKIKYVICIIVFVLWFYYRIISDKFELYSFTTISILKYFDIIAVYAFCNFVILFRRFCKKQRNKPIEFRDGFIRDVPIDNEKDDDFKRKKFARAAVDKILRTDTTKEAFSYGIVSSWGMGKTSFMNLMKKWIDQEYSDKCIVVDFNPWLYSRDANIVELFFDELNKVLRQYDSRLANSFINYSKALSAIGTTETKIASAFIDLIGRRSSLDEKINTIRDFVRNIKKRIVIFVDDIDRLEPNEIMDVLKLVRNVSNFPNMYFVVAYDKEYLLECLKDKMSTKASDFTEKIFNTEFYLPLCVKDTLKGYIEKYVSSDVSVEEKKELHEVIYKTIFDNSDKDSISTVRDVKRICNAFNTSYSQLKDEVNVCDLFALEILKNKYPTIYAILDKDRKYVLEQTHNRYILYDKEKERTIDFDDLFIDNPFNYDLKKYIIDNKDGLHIKESDIKKIENLLNILFPNQPVSADEKRINNIYYTYRYFNVSLLESDISDIDFAKVLSYDIDDIKPILKEWTESKPIALSAKLEKIHSLTKDEQKKHLHLLLYLISIMPHSQNPTIIPYPYTAITNKMNELGTFNDDKKLSNDDKQFIKEVLCENGYSIGLGNYLSSISFEANQWDYPLPKEVLNEVRNVVFNDCIKHYSDDMRTVLQGFNLTKETYLEKGKTWFRLIPANNSLMKEYAISHFSDFIKHSIRQNTYSDKEYRYNIQNLPWESLDDYISFIKSIEPKTPIIDEYLAFVERCKEKNPTEGPMEPIGFEFKYIKFGES